MSDPAENMKNKIDTVVTKITDEALIDQAGTKSSKRVWAYRFGWATIWQVVILNAGAVVFTVLQKDMPQIVFEIAKFSISATLIGNLTLMGLTIPEWFAPKKKD